MSVEYLSKTHQWVNHRRHCEERSDVAIHKILDTACALIYKEKMDCRVERCSPRNDARAKLHVQGILQ